MGVCVVCVFAYFFYLIFELSRFSVSVAGPSMEQMPSAKKKKKKKGSGVNNN